MNRDPEAEYRAGHIPGAIRFDIDTVKDRSSPLPHMLPAPEAFAAAVGALGIGDGITIVVYDGAGLFSAPRVWWTLPHLRRGGRAHSRGRLSGLEGGGTARRDGRAAPARAAPLHGPARSGRGRRRRRRQGRARQRLGAGRRFARPPTASAARRRSRAPACAPGTCRAAATCRSPPSSRTAASRTRTALRGGARGSRRRSRAADHHELRLRRLRLHHEPRARDDGTTGQGALRRLVGRVGRARRPAGRDG